MKRYKELKYQDKIFTETYKINEILIENDFQWFLDCEIENARIEITKNTLVFNSGVFFNGTWVYGVFRDGQWKYGTWEGGVWYNGTWYNGIYKNGLIFNGRFLNGKIEGGEIRGGEFFDIVIGEDVIKNIEKPNKNSPKPQQGHPQNRGVGQKEIPVQPKVQPQKIEERYIKTYEKFFGLIKDKPKPDDKMGESLYKYLSENDYNVNSLGRGEGLIRDSGDNLFLKDSEYQVIIGKGALPKDIDPLGEEGFVEEMIVKILTLKKVKNLSQVIGDSNKLKKIIVILIDNDMLVLSKDLKEKIRDVVEKKYNENKNKEKKNRFNKYRDLLGEEE